MTEHVSPSPEHEAIEVDMKRLAKEVLERRENPEYRGLSEKELLKRSLERLTPPSGKPAAPPPPSPLPSYLESASAEIKLEVEYLLDMAFHQGIEKANAAARRSHPFVVDAFHDALVGKLYPELKKRGLL